MEILGEIDQLRHISVASNQNIGEEEFKHIAIFLKKVYNPFGIRHSLKKS